MKKRTVLVLFFVLCTAVFSFLAHPTSTLAASGNQWASWVVHMEFDDDQIDAKLIIEIGHEARGGTHVVDIRKTYPITCQDVGPVIIDNDAAYFDGSGYLQCEMPNFQEMVTILSEGQLEIGEACSCKQAYGLANFTFENLSGNALFYMQDLAFSAPTQNQGNQAQYKLVVNGAEAISESFLITRQMQYGSAHFNQLGAGYAPLFHVDSMELGSTPAFIAGKLEIPTNQTEFYVGFNPDTGEFLSGKLEKLEIDPGCVGHGGI